MNFTMEKKQVVIGIVIILLLTVGYNIISNFNDVEYTITVTDKERIYIRNGDTSSSKYLVFGDNEDGDSLVFENTDCLVRGKWNSSDIQGQLKEGHTYEIVVVGYRIPFFSMYQNIIQIEEIE